MVQCIGLRVIKEQEVNMMPDKKVIIYSTPTCPYCHQVKSYLTEKGVPFEDKNVADDIEARNEMMQKSSGLSVPVIDIDGTIVVGFNRPKIDELLSL